jgi:hypothetical protein
MACLLVTLDTNTIDHRPRIEAACAGLDVELAFTTVTRRETEGTSRSDTSADPDTVVETGVWNESEWNSFVWGAPVYETAVIGEWHLGSAVLGSSSSPFEEILEVIGGGSFPPPGKRDGLSAGVRRQLRDAMILEAHWRDRRDVFVTEDVTGFIDHGRRDRLEALCRTRIMTVDQFCNSVSELAS